MTDERHQKRIQKNSGKVKTKEVRCSAILNSKASPFFKIHKVKVENNCIRGNPNVYGIVRLMKTLCFIKETLMICNKREDKGPGPYNISLSWVLVLDLIM
jgi:hypothetical protein